MNITDTELVTMEKFLRLLRPLSRTQQKRVLCYVCARLDIEVGTMLPTGGDTVKSAPRAAPAE